MHDDIAWHHVVTNGSIWIVMLEPVLGNCATSHNWCAVARSVMHQPSPFDA
jgi:hypothetical protein